MPCCLRERALRPRRRRRELEGHRGCDGLPHEHEEGFSDLQPHLSRIFRRTGQTESYSHNRGSRRTAHLNCDRAEGDRGGEIISKDRAFEGFIAILIVMAIISSSLE